MADQNIEFVVFPHDNAWKLYRDGELVCIFSDQMKAETSASDFVAALKRHGKAAALEVLVTLEEAIARGLEPEG